LHCDFGATHLATHPDGAARQGPRDEAPEAAFAAGPEAPTPTSPRPVPRPASDHKGVLPVLKLRGAFFDKGLHAFFLVVAGKQ